MDYVQFIDLPYSAGASGTSTVYIGYHDQILFNISAVASKFTSGVINFTLQGTHNSSTSARTANYYDYVCQQPYECVVTASTAGLYEVPFAGGIPYIRVGFDTAATVAGTITVVFPRAD